MFLKMSTLLTVSFLVLLTMGCSPSSDSPKATPDRDSDLPLSELEKASCEFKPEDGAAAPSFTPERKVVSSFFKKNIDEALLLPLLKASATEIVRFAKFANVDFYSVAAKSTRSCQNLAFIPAASSEKVDVFTQIQGRNTDSTILGVYFSPENKDFKGQNKDAFILVRKDTTKWTLVHEYMHHLFSKETQGVRKDNQLIADIDKAATAFEKNYKDYELTKSKQSLFAAVQNLETVVEARVEMLKRYTLEEITIESVLMGHYNAGRFTQVPKVEYRGAKAYISSSLNVAKKTKTDLTSFIDASTSELKTISATTPELAAEADQLNLKFEDHKAKLKALMTEANDLYSKSLYYSGMEDSMASREEKIEHGPGCTHGKNVENKVDALIHKISLQLAQ